MQDTVKPSRFNPGKAYHGHIKLELFDAKTGDLVKKVERDNLVTNALAALMNNVAGGVAGYIDDLVMPVCTRALGGLMIFDGPLEESADNVEFPGDVSITAYATRDINTGNTKRGSLNSAETGRITNGYRSVWDFGTSQANGIIHGISLTNYLVEPFAGVDTSRDNHTIINTAGNDEDSNVVHYDGEYVYYTRMSGNRETIQQQYTDRWHYTYRTTITVNVWRERVPLDNYKVADGINAREYPTLVKTQSMTWDSYDLTYPYDGYTPMAGYDGYVYFVYTPGNATGNGNIKWFRMRVDDLSFEFSEVQSIEPTECYLRRGHGVVNNGYLYIRANNMRSLYKINLSNTADVSTIQLPDGYYLIDTNENRGHYAFVPNPAGGLYLRLYKAAANGQAGYYDKYTAFLTKNDVITINGGYYRRETDTSYFAENVAYRNYEKCQGWTYFYGYFWWYGYIGRALTNYLGTIANLDSPIVKNASQTLKITYTLTNAE